MMNKAFNVKTVFVHHLFSFLFPPAVIEVCNGTICLDFDPVQFGGKLVVDCKHVSVLNLFALRLLGKHSLRGLSTRQRLQRSYQLPLRDIRLLLDLLR